MQNTSNFVKIPQELFDHPIYSKSQYVHVWVECARCAAWKRHDILYAGDAVTLEIGEFIFGRLEWSKRLRIRKSTLQDIISKFVKLGLISVSRKSFYSGTVYRLLPMDSDPPTNVDNLKSVSRPSAVRQPSVTNKIDRLDRKERSVKSLASNVSSKISDATKSQAAKYAAYFEEEDKLGLWEKIVGSNSQADLAAAYSFIVDYPNAGKQEKAKLFQWKLKDMKGGDLNE